MRYSGQVKVKSQARSFRLTEETATLLDETANIAGVSRNELAGRLLSEALRRERHPLITFRTGSSGHRRAALAGSRLDVRNVIETFIAEGRNADLTVRYFDHVDPRLVRAAIEYHLEFPDDTDREIETARLSDEAAIALWHRADRTTA